MPGPAKRRHMTDDAPDLVVLRQNSRGSTAEPYAADLRARLPDHDIRVAHTPQEERELLAAAPVATGISIDAALLEAAPNLRYFACVFSGHGHLPMDALREHGVAVTTGAGIHAPNLAEWVLGQLLVFARDLKEGWRRQQRREWRHYQAGELYGSTVTVVGLGAIGHAVVERLEPFGVETLGVRYTPEKGGPTDEVFGLTPEDVHEAFSRTDYLVLTTPLTETTAQLVDAETLQTLPPDAVIVNGARGGIIDTDALIAELQGNGIRGAALDVTDPEPLPPDHPLWGFENVHITPHNSGGSPTLTARMADIVAENLERVEETGEYADLRNQVLALDG